MGLLAFQNSFKIFLIFIVIFAIQLEKSLINGKTGLKCYVCNTLIADWSEQNLIKGELVKDQDKNCVTYPETAIIECNDATKGMAIEWQRWQTAVNSVENDADKAIAKKLIDENYLWKSLKEHWEDVKVATAGYSDCFKRTIKLNDKKSILKLTKDEYTDFFCGRAVEPTPKPRLDHFFITDGTCGLKKKEEIGEVQYCTCKDDRNPDKDYTDAYDKACKEYSEIKGGPKDNKERREGNKTSISNIIQPSIGLVFLGSVKIGLGGL